MLNLLSIWFRHGNIREVSEVLMNDPVNINTINLDCWLGVVPQLIACMNHKDKGCREALHKLLERLGKKHPQVHFKLYVPLPHIAFWTLFPWPFLAVYAYVRLTYICRHDG